MLIIMDSEIVGSSKCGQIELPFSLAPRSTCRPSRFFVCNSFVGHVVLPDICAFSLDPAEFSFCFCHGEPFRGSDPTIHLARVADDARMHGVLLGARAFPTDIELAIEAWFKDFGGFIPPVALLGGLQAFRGN